uniref:pyruvate dehydrogenase (acetyl-transferring) n=1 Tax=Davidia involucrata TaxID=16924 RepID=A0A5B7AVF4_DAVIN
MVSCSTPYNAKGLMKAAIRSENPLLLFEHVLLCNLKERIPDEECIVTGPTPYAGTLEEWTVVQPAQIVAAVEQLCPVKTTAPVVRFSCSKGLVLLFKLNTRLLLSFSWHCFNLIQNLQNSFSTYPLSDTYLKVKQPTDVKILL